MRYVALVLLLFIAVGHTMAHKIPVRFKGFRYVPLYLWEEDHAPVDSVRVYGELVRVEKELTYDKYTLADTYPYGSGTREFQWTKIKTGLARLDSLQNGKVRWGVFQNYKHRNGHAPVARGSKENDYERLQDSYGVERYQSVPLYFPTNLRVPERYGRDGSLVKILHESGDSVFVEPVHIGGIWVVPKKYMRNIDHDVVFRKVVFVDRANQNIMTLEKEGEIWKVRSMNPATTGVRNPPYAQPTPEGIFVVQDKRLKMYFYVDGTTDIGGFAPFASRFSNGGYIHGVPVNEPSKEIIEYSWTLGTTPRSHMCVRNATSHAEYVYKWGTEYQTLVFVL